MSSKSIFCLAASRWQADNIVDRLKTAGFENKEISVLFADKKDSSEFAERKHTKSPETRGAEGTAAGAGAGGVVGGTVGLLAGIGSIVIPGLGPFIAVGPILATLSGAAMGATVGGIAGGLIGLGIPEVKARHYECRVKEGFILISVHTDDAEKLHRARLIFEEADAADIANSDELKVAEKYEPKEKCDTKESRPADRSYVGRDW
jgi:hypothetical protein